MLTLFLKLALAFAPRALLAGPHTNSSLQRNRCPGYAPVALTAVLILVPAAVLGLTTGACHAESPADAIARIRSGSHIPMPSPQVTHASGPAGKGMSIENDTGHVLRVHFSGPVSCTVEVPNGQSVGVELIVGRYEVATEVPDTSILPFYGIQTYQPHAHYWLKFFLQTRYR